MKKCARRKPSRFWGRLPGRRMDHCAGWAAGGGSGNDSGWKI